MDSSRIAPRDIGSTIWGWIALSQSLHLGDDTLMQAVRLLLGLVRPDRIYAMRSSEPCRYRSTEEGLAALADALRNRCVSFLEFELEPRAHAGEGESLDEITYAEIVLSLPASYAATIDIRIGSRDRSHMLAHADNLVAFIRTSFVMMNAAYGCASSIITYQSAGGQITYDMDGRDLLPSIEGAQFDRCARGAFWANALGEEISARLGGPEQVLANAPTLIRERLGSGIWLQLSSTPPASKAEVDELAQYLQPVFHAEDDNYQSTAVPGITFPEKRGTISWPQVLSTRVSRSTTATDEKLSVIPIRQLKDDAEYVFVANIHLAISPTEAQCESVITALVRWYDRVESLRAPSHVFRDIRDLVINGMVIRWSAETYTLEWDDILRILEIELGAIDDINVIEVVIGTETVG